ncbi:hypothetical protein [Corynebacterium evansiae]|uniref:Low molecular weight antigen MTB12-like C-terminal domain-containing protein n=1 Tax=Corynebacterium evansiae TaxID=2913499 RepID=A0A9X3LLZ4_9CORY|nr:hypothetical protein [Corynebacterium evansiae]MCZ9290385.1 hypothetical protein [Corynebacterium evansiae]
MSDNDLTGPFGDSGNVSEGIPEKPRQNEQSSTKRMTASGINWPTVGTSVLASAVVAALFLGFGLQVGRDRMDSAEALANTQTAPEQSLQSGSESLQADSTPRPSATPSATATPTPSAAASANGGSSNSDTVAGAAGTAGGAVTVGAEDTGATGNAQQAQSGDNTADPNTGWYPAQGISASFAATNPIPSLDDLNGVIHALVATPGSDEEKANNLEGGISAAVVPRTVYNLGIFREPLGWKRVSGPLSVNGNTASATLNASSAGRPTISMRINFIYQDGRWKLATSSLRNGVQAVGLPVADAF